MSSFEIGSVVLDSTGTPTTKDGMSGEIYDAFNDNLAADVGIAIPPGADGLAIRSNLAMLANRIATGAVKHIVNFPAAAGAICLLSGSTAQAGLSTSYIIVKEWTQNGVVVGEITPAFATDNITIRESGVYHISFYISFQGTTNTQWTFATYINNSIDGDLRCRVDTPATSAQVVSTSFSGFFQLNAGQILDVRVQANAGSKSIITRQAGLSVNLIKWDPV